MVDINKTISQNESENKGMEIYLYFNPEIGFYTTYGVSAFLADHIIEGPKAFSDAYQMPVMIVTPGEVQSLRNSTQKLEHEAHSFYHFRLRNPIGADGYAKWAQSLKKKV